MSLEISSSSNSSPIKLKTFLGLHECPDGDTKLTFGESPVMENLRITSRFGEKKNNGGNLQTRPGNRTIIGLAKGYVLSICNTETLLITETLKDNDDGVTVYGYNTATTNDKGFVVLSMSSGNAWQVNRNFLKSTQETNVYFKFGYYDYKFSRYTELDNGDGTFTFCWYAKKVVAAANSDNTNYKVQGIWSGVINGRDTLLCACNGRLWSIWDSVNNEFVKNDVGAIDCTNKISFFPFDGKVYMLNGKEYKVFDGSRCENVKGYRPKIAVRDPDGGNSTLIEGVNKLTGERAVIFNTNGTSTEFILPEQNIVSVDYVMQNSTGEYISPTTYSYNLTTGKVTFTTAPAAGTRTLEIGYTAINTFRSEITSMRFFELFNGNQDTRVFLYGNGTNEAVYSDVDYWQKIRADYFPDLNEVAVGASNTPIMDMCRHNSMLIVNKSNESYFIEQSATTDSEGLIVTTFSTTPISKTIGSSVLGQMQIVENDPRFLYGKELYMWESVNYYGTIKYDERQAKRISDRIYETLSTFDIANTYCFDYNYGQEYYICNNNKAIVNNYANNTWYIYTDLDINYMCEFMNELYFGTTDGKLQKFSEEFYANDGEEIKAYWESGYMDFGYENMRKSSSYIYVVLNPESGGKMLLTATTDRRAEFADKTVNATLFDFGNVNFGDFTFNTNHSAKTKRLKLKMKKFVFCKLILKSAGLDTRFTALSIAIDTRITGKAK